MNQILTCHNIIISSIKHLFLTHFLPCWSQAAPSPEKGRGLSNTPVNSHMLTGAITVSYPDCAVGSVDNEGRESEMCTAAFHYEIVCITVIQRASCSLWRVPDSWVGNLRDSGEAQLISGHIWHGLHGCYKNQKWNRSHKKTFRYIGGNFLSARGEVEGALCLPFASDFEFSVGNGLLVSHTNDTQ